MGKKKESELEEIKRALRDQEGAILELQGIFHRLLYHAEDSEEQPERKFKGCPREPDHLEDGVA